MIIAKHFWSQLFLRMIQCNTSWSFCSWTNKLNQLFCSSEVQNCIFCEQKVNNSARTLTVHSLYITLNQIDASRLWTTRTVGRFANCAPSESSVSSSFRVTCPSLSPRVDLHLSIADANRGLKVDHKTAKTWDSQLSANKKKSEQFRLCPYLTSHETLHQDCESLQLFFFALV